MRERITPSLIISILALVVALGGASYAAIKIPRNSVGPAQLKRGAVSTPKLKGRAVTAAKLRTGSVTAPKLAGEAVTSRKLRAGAVTSDAVLDGSLQIGDFAEGQIPGETSYASRDGGTLLDLEAGPLVDVVATPPLPAGNYLLMARANIISGAASSTVLCSMGNDAAQNFVVAANAVFPLSLSTAARLVEDSPVSLGCSKSAGTPQVAQAHVIAVRIGELTRTPPLE